MKEFALGVGLLASAGTVVSAQQPEADPDRVVAAINGIDYTAAELDRLRNSLPDIFRRQTQHMDNKAFLETFGYLKTLERLAREAGLPDTEPYKTQLEFNTTNFLANAYLAQINSTLSITQEDQKNYYEEHKDEYLETRISAIYVDYTPIPELAEEAGKEVVTEQEAWARAEQLLAELRAGENFAELARERSDDGGSAEDGGDLGYFTPDDQLSDAVKEAIFSLEEGQVSSPVKDSGRYLIFKVTEKRPRAYSEVAPVLLRRLQQEKLKERLESIRESVDIEYKDPEYIED